MHFLQIDAFGAYHGMTYHRKFSPPFGMSLEHERQIHVMRQCSLRVDDGLGNVVARGC